MVRPQSDIDGELYQRWRALEAQPASPRFAPGTLRAAWWAWRAVRRARRELAHKGVAAAVRKPPRVGWGSRTGVYGVLVRTAPTCLERCLVAQRWLLAFDVPTTIVIGVRRTDTGAVAAHAWIDEAAQPDEYDGFQVIHRMGPPA